MLGNSISKCKKMRLTLSRQFSHSTWLMMWSMVLFWSDMAGSQTLDFYHAVVKYSYMDKATGELHSGDHVDGTYGLGNRPEMEEGRLIHVESDGGKLVVNSLEGEFG